jgi:hypothetical protein
MAKAIALASIKEYETPGDMFEAWARLMKSISMFEWEKEYTRLMQLSVSQL